MIRVGLIGLGYWGSKLQRYLEDNRGFDVITSRRINTEILNDKSIQALVVATPNDTHYELTKTALEYGKHVLCEKPLAFKTEQCEDLKTLASLYGLQVTVEYTFTFSRCIQKMIDYCQRPKFISMNVKHLGRFGGGNVYWLLGSHMLSILDMIKPLDNLIFRKSDLLIHDGVVETGRIDFGNCSLTGEVNLSLNHPYKRVQIEIYNDDNTIIYNPGLGNLEVISYERPEWDINIPTQKSSWNLDESNNLKYAIEHFYRVITGKEESNLDRAVRVTKVLEDIGA